jgi:2-iminoacetate synthase ThiH
VGYRLSREEIVRQIKDAGYEARQRDQVYRFV